MFLFVDCRMGREGGVVFGVAERKILGVGWGVVGVDGGGWVLEFWGRGGRGCVGVGVGGGGFGGGLVVFEAFVVNFL